MSNVHDVSASQAPRSLAPSPLSAIVRGRKSDVNRAAPLLPPPRLADEQIDFNVPASSQMTLVEPATPQTRTHEVLSRTLPRTTLARRTAPAESSAHNQPDLAEMRSPLSTRTVPIKKKRRTQPEVAVPHIEDVLRRRRNFASSGTLYNDPAQAQRRKGDSGPREDRTEIEQEPMDEVRGDHDSGLALSNVEEVGEIPNAASGKEGSAMVSLRHSHPIQTPTGRLSRQHDEVEDLYPNLETRSSDDERTHQKLSRSQHVARLSREREHRANTAASSLSRSIRQSEHHDFSVSEDDSSEEDMAVDDVLPIPNRSTAVPNAFEVEHRVRASVARATPLSVENQAMPGRYAGGGSPVVQSAQVAVPDYAQNEVIVPKKAATPQRPFTRAQAKLRRVPERSRAERVP